MNNFFNRNTFVINQKVFTVANTYQVQSEDGNQIGTIKEDLPLSRILLSFVLNKKYLPFTLDITDAEGNLVTKIEKKWSFLTASLDVLNGQGVKIAKINQKFTLLKPSYEIFDSSDKLIATIKGNFIEWDFNITDPNGSVLATISKKFDGILKTLFTDADKYVVSVQDSLVDENVKQIIVSCAAVIDMINREINS